MKLLFFLLYVVLDGIKLVFILCVFGVCKVVLVFLFVFFLVLGVLLFVLLIRCIEDEVGFFECEVVKDEDVFWW